MATSTLPSSGLAVRARTDDVFFSAMALLILGSVLLGFGRSYYFAGVFHAPLPNPLVHGIRTIHSRIQSGWPGDIEWPDSGFIGVRTRKAMSVLLAELQQRL
jgi:hypothetical protein